ncbi:hypothetical protein BHF71_02795 [Vulcanibacillus modesticaldus]|uniref:Sulfotransferase domain-containing protein n=1 Tax=Vulcanibacillus modesticaldus TaxID=337097 RepID=A0A1D2YT47_9BACI|nr:sulfotransferase [Vulcanibacillus modesticaldus]OEF98872.1 hypothetical protein BHF71_02795 [Vulcanibacillus modesticaldus]
MIKLIISSATHRMGSTLLQRICNTRKETLIWGEHGGALTDFANIYINLLHFSIHSKKERDAYFDNGEDVNQWIASMTPDIPYVEKAIIQSVKSFFNNLYNQYKDSHDFVGFKEVRYGERELTLFRKCYPEAKIFLLVRNPVDTYASVNRKWYPTIEDFTEKWKKNVSYYIDLDKKDPNAFLLRYEDIVNKSKVTLELISKITKVSVKDIEEVLKHKLRSTKKPITEDEKRFIIKKCQQVMKKLGYQVQY